MVSSMDILTKEASLFLEKLHRQFNSRRLELLEKRKERQKALDRGEKPDFLPETRKIREDLSWKVALVPADLQQRWVEITGPTDRKMVINALNCGADVFMADFEDANSPTWKNLLEGQQNLMDAVNGTISFVKPDGTEMRLNQKIATLMVRPRGWHLNEKHYLVDGEEISGSLFDFGLYFFHNGKKRPYFYLPKLESHEEARLWNDVFIFSQKELGIPVGTIRATVLIETILAAFEMDEILYELKEHSAGLNAGRWDYIFSIIKKFHKNPKVFLPNRDQIVMTVPFMRAYTRLLVQTCKKREAQPIGGMSAFIPNRKDPVVTEKALQKVREDKLREANDGFVGTWVAHPDLVPIAREVFENHFRAITAADLLNFTIPNSQITEEGVRHNISIALQYMAAWLSGTGAAAINNLMEDAATAEISRAQVWQWLHQGARLEDGRVVSKEMVEKIIEEESKGMESKALLQNLIMDESFADFFTTVAYNRYL